MNRLAFAAALAAVTAAPLSAQTVPPTQPPAAEPGLIEQLFGGILNQMFEDASPHLDNLGRDLNALAESMKPTFDNIGALIDDIGNYERPERLPNGDVIIRRKPGAPPPPALPDLPEGGLAPIPPAPAPAPADPLLNAPGPKIEI